AVPFRHIVWDNFLEPALAEAVRASFPSLRAMTVQINRFTERKTQESNLAKMPEPARRAHAELAAPRFLALLERITGFPRLSADARDPQIPRRLLLLTDLAAVGAPARAQYDLSRPAGRTTSSPGFPDLFRGRGRSLAGLPTAPQFASPVAPDLTSRPPSLGRK